MQVSKIIDLKGFDKAISFLKINKKQILLLFCFLFGFLVALFSLKKSSPFKSFWTDYLYSFVDLRADSDFLKITYKSFLQSFTYVVLIFISGCSLLGLILLPFFVFTNGFVYGALISLLYSGYGLKGVAFNAVLVLPPAILFVSAIILAAGHSVDFSLKLAKLVFPRSQPFNLAYDFKNYCGKFITYSVITFFSALLDAFISRFFFAGFKL